jgi:predicted amidohydrolase
VKVAAYQAPVSACGSIVEALALIRERIKCSESASVEILCCPEGILGGLADYATQPTAIAIDVEDGQLNTVLAPLSSETVTTIIGFTEIDGSGLLYNSAAVFHKGAVAGLYRKLHPAINRSVYKAGHEMPTFQVGGLKFGVIICNDSNYAELARFMSAQGATALFIPTNNSLPLARAHWDLVSESRKVDITTAVDNNMWVIRSDVAGRTPDLVSYGSSRIVNAGGKVIRSGRRLRADLIVADIETARP